MAGEPLSTESAAEYLSRYIVPEVMYTAQRYAGLAALLVASGLVGFAFADRRQAAPVIAWAILATGSAGLYGYSGYLIGADTIAPWNAVMRNSFYVWVPLACFGTIGLAGIVLAASGDARTRSIGWTIRRAHRPFLGIGLGSSWSSPSRNPWFASSCAISGGSGG